MKKYKITIELEVQASTLREAHEKADDIQVHYKLKSGGYEIYPTAITVTEPPKDDIVELTRGN